MNVLRGGEEEFHVFLISISDGDLHDSLALAPAEFSQAAVATAKLPTRHSEVIATMSLFIREHKLISDYKGF
jgi:hypothetical protein